MEIILEVGYRDKYTARLQTAVHAIAYDVWNQEKGLEYGRF